MKTCTACKTEKPFDLFYPRYGRKSGYSPTCRACKNADRVALKKQDPDAAEKQQKWRDANPEKIKQYESTRKDLPSRLAWKKEYNPAYFQKNKTHINGTRRVYHEENKDDLAYLTKRRLRARLKIAIKKGYKSGSAVSDLGMSIKDFLQYLDNDCMHKYGETYSGNESKYHIDHVIPLSAFDLADKNQLLIAVRWDNMQVLTAAENRSKGARIL